jgi:hypothetical protein
LNIARANWVGTIHSFTDVTGLKIETLEPPLGFLQTGEATEEPQDAGSQASRSPEGSLLSDYRYGSGWTNAPKKKSSSFNKKRAVQSFSICPTALSKEPNSSRPLINPTAARYYRSTSDHPTLCSSHCLLTSSILRCSVSQPELEPNTRLPRTNHWIEQDKSALSSLVLYTQV